MRALRSFGLLALYIGAQLVALVLAFPFKGAGLATTSNPNSATDPLYIIVLIVLAPIAILWLVRRSNGPALLRGVILVGIAASLVITLQATFALVTPAPFFLPYAQAGYVGDLSSILAVIVAVLILVALLIEPQWYVVDATGFLAAGSLIALLGISFGILPTFVLLGALAVYDFVAVYVTKHMVSLADVVTDLKLPILMVMPSGPGYDYTRAPTLQQQRARPTEEREAMFMGLGDVVIPGVLVVSAFVSLPTSPHFLGLGGNLLAAVGALVGSLLGYALLMRQVAGGNPQAGLPFLNGGAIAGYAVAYLLVFHSLGLGLTLSF
ncbi:MAG: presenilin family intramembrane aspartyl protease PSH [Thermoplasmata archaeon]